LKNDAAQDISAICDPAQAEENKRKHPEDTLRQDQVLLTLLAHCG
jgi:hypothetical protein